MNVATTEHPARPQLAAFSLGDLAPEAAAEIEAHVEQCPACSRILLELASDADSFVALLQRAGREQAVTVSSEDTDRSEAKRLAEDAELPDLPPELTDHPRYRLMERLGRGGMGDVYQAEHRLMNRLVALKVINRRLLSQPGAVERFHREVQAAARLVHPNIVTAFDAEQAGDLHFLAMEYVPGVDLAQVIKQRGPLQVREACEYVRQAAIGLQHAHEQGMVHRDIKPHNLILAEGHVKILDFGLASFANETLNQQIALSGQRPASDQVPDRLTSLGAMLGTPDYVAPEQVENPHAVDIRADIYSLGCTLYALLAGRPPFSEATVADKIRAHAQQDPEPIERLRPDVPAELAEIIRHMLAKDPADRPATPREVAESLAAFVQPEVVRGATTGSRRRLSSVRLRWLAIPGPIRRLAVATAASLAVLAVVWGVVILIRIKIQVSDGSKNHASRKGSEKVTLPPQGSEQKPPPPKKRGAVGWPHDGQNLGNTNYHPRASSRRSEQLSFRAQWDKPNAMTVRTADVTGDGRLEVIYLENVGRARPLVVVDGAGQELWRRDPVAESQVKHPDAQTNPYYDVADLDGDGACEILVNVNCDQGGTSNAPNRVLIYCGDGRLQKNLVLEDAAAAHLLVADVRGDAEPELVVGMADYCAEHGAYVYRRDGSLIARTLTGEALYVRAVADLDPDGLREVFFSNFASHNEQPKVNGVDDCHAYVLAVKGDGRARWVRELGTCATDVVVADLRGTGTPDLVAFRNQEPLRYSGRSEVHLLDKATGQTRARYDGPQDLRWTSWAMADLDRDGARKSPSATSMVTSGCWAAT